jgi:glycosyltransferase involved in cell wall biosynthesis
MRVSVIIPAYNRADLLPQTLDSVLAQTRPAAEIIVVDDASTDDTSGQVVARYAGRVTLIRNTINRGVTASTNIGISAATGEAIALLDSDDLFAPDKLAQQTAFLATHPDIGVVNSRFWHIDAHGQRLEKSPLQPTERHPLRALATGGVFWTSGTLIRRAALARVTPLDETIATHQDWDLFIALARTGVAFGVIQRPLGSYRVHRAGFTGSGDLYARLSPVLDKLYAQPGLPSDVVAAKPEAYAVLHRWVATHDYAAGDVAAGRAQLDAMLTLMPGWAEPVAFGQLVRGMSQSQRVDDRVAFIEQVWAGLPVQARAARSQLPRVRAQTHMQMAIRAVHAGDPSEARARFALAAAAQPDARQLRTDFREALSQMAVSLPVEAPLGFARAVLALTPPPLAAAAHDALGSVAIAAAFDAHAEGRAESVRAHVRTAFRHRPALMRNRGAWALLLRS